MKLTRSWRHLGLASLLQIVPACISAEPVKTPPDGTGAGAVGGGGIGSTGGAASTGGNAHTSVASGEGGSLGTGGELGAGGVNVATGGRPTTGGAPPATGGAAPEMGGATTSATGGATVGTNANCDFAKADCATAASCASFTGPSDAWKVPRCQALLQCLEDNSACITAADPLCGPIQNPYEPPVCGDAYSSIASDSSVTVLLTTLIKCACGL